MKYEIHPAIGIARVGSSRVTSEDGFFLGPEPGVSPPVKYRDSAGNLKRQAARFRVFACRRDDCGKLLDATEVTLNDVRSITWTVHLVNRKGAARRQFRSGPGYRNHAIGHDVADRALIIDPGPRVVSTPGVRAVFDTGMFRATPVPLGEVVMESNGRLRVLGGFGRSGSDPQQPRLNLSTGHHAENDNWYDDTSDGPVSVHIQLNDGTIAESSAWLIVAPPDFAPGIRNFLTLYDVIYDLAVRRGLLVAPTDPPQKPSFTRHIQPILACALGYRWVNRAAPGARMQAAVFGHDATGAGNSSALWAALADSTASSATLRDELFSRLRNPDRSAPNPNIDPLELLPRLRNVDLGRSGAGDVLALTMTQYQLMHAWADGNFINDLNHALAQNDSLPDALDREALDACVGGALDPGIEATGAVLLDSARYLDGEPFRLSHAAVRPGDVTEFNSVPWQTDFLACQWEELSGPWPRRLAWWPAQRPDDVYAAPDDPEMVPWTRGLGDDYQDMIDKWDRLGVVVNHGSPGKPFYIEQERDKKALGP